LLQTHRYWPGADLADRLEVSVRTLRRDVDRLRELGYPVEANRGVEGGYQLAPGAALPPLVVDDDEAVALAVGMQAAAQGAVAGIEESSVRALTKLIQVMPPRLRRRIDALREVTDPVPFAGTASQRVDPDALITVAQGCRDAERLEFGYRPPDRDATTRTVDPHRLVSVGRRWYLVGYDLDRHDWRSFRMDRITGVRRTGARFAPRQIPGGDAATFVQTGLTRRATIETVAEVQAPAADVRARIGSRATVEELTENQCLVMMNADDLTWAALALGTLGAEFVVRSPIELVELIREWGARFGRATSAHQGT